MTIQNLTRQLRSLPYADMMQVATQIAAELKVHPHLVAQVLVSLHEKDIELADSTKQEERLLREAFSRKRVINVSRQSTGWSIGCPTLPGSNVLGTELRPMFPLLLDQIITMHAMTRGTK